MHQRELPVIRACEQSWEDLDGDGRTRHCETCDHAVINLSAMSAAEARQVIERARTTRVCVRYRYGADGMVMFAPANGLPLASPIFGVKPIALGLTLLAAAPLAIPGAPPEVPPPVVAAPVEPAPPPPPVLEAIPAARPPAQKRRKAKPPPPVEEVEKEEDGGGIRMGMFITAF